MGEFKGTTGPWIVEAASSSSIEVVTEHQVKVCDIIADNDEDLIQELEWDNARLIAAAPDLLSACVAALKRSDEILNVDFNGERSPENQSVYDQVKAAIIKALGEG